MFWEFVGQLVIATSVVLGGIHTYFRQKEYELVRQRYLDEGLDVLVSAAQSSLDNVAHNWSRALLALKLFRDLNEPELDDIDVDYIPLPQHRFSLIANYRADNLLEDPIVWDTFQLVIAFCDNANGMIVNDFAVALKKYVRTPSDPRLAPKEELVEQSFEELKKLNEESHSHQAFVSCITRIANEFEKQRFSFKSLQKFKHNDKVRAALKDLRDVYADKLKQEDEDEPSLAGDQFPIS